MLSAERLRSLLSYDSETGVFRWRGAAGQGGRIPAGSVAGSAGNAEGYRYITIDKKAYRVSRLAWLYVHGEWPPHQVDHINLDTSDDRMCNLRLATQSQNKANCRRYSNNCTGFKGVSFRPEVNKYRTRISANGKTTTVGYFETRELAHEAYCMAADKLHGEFARAA